MHCGYNVEKCNITITTWRVRHRALSGQSFEHNQRHSTHHLQKLVQYGSKTKYKS